ncbi:MAG: permease [Alphaproteobacteria bacterium]|nr:permease [Alphaproteobacteria bacterium]MDD9920320.1 permease [Alphaproteobacteria bacterium]
MTHCHSPSPQPACCSGNKRKFDFIFWGSLVGIAALYVLGTFFAGFTAGHSWLATMAHTVHYMVHTVWWGVVIGAVFVGLLSKIPQVFIMSVLGKGGTFNGLLRAVGAGVLFDLCSHGLLMVAVKLYQRGASIGQIVAFLLASPWNSFSLTLILVTLIGWQWTFVFIGLSIVIALITGWVFDRFVARGWLPENHNTVDMPEDFHFWKDARTGIQATRFDFAFFKDIFVNGVKDSRIVLRWLLFGILLAAALRALLDPTQFEGLFGPTFIGLLVTVVFATVLEVCSEGSTPIAADILTRAQAPGNGFAFLMAGVATDYTEIMVLKDTTKSWKIALFLPLISVPQVMLVAWLVNFYG